MVQGPRKANGDSKNNNSSTASNAAPDAALRGEGAAPTTVPPAEGPPDIGAGRTNVQARRDMDQSAGSVPVVEPHGNPAPQYVKQASAPPIHHVRDRRQNNRRVSVETVLLAIRVGLQHLLNTRRNKEYVSVSVIVVFLGNNYKYVVAPQLIHKIIVDYGPHFLFFGNGTAVFLFDNSPVDVSPYAEYNAPRKTPRLTNVVIVVAPACDIAGVVLCQSGLLAELFVA